MAKLDLSEPNTLIIRKIYENIDLGKIKVISRVELAELRLSAVRLAELNLLAELNRLAELAWQS